MKRTVSNDHHKKITSKLDNLYKEEKSKGFALHMIRAYLPLDKISKVFSAPKKCTCSLCKNELFTVTQVIETAKLDEFGKEESFWLKQDLNSGVDVYKELPIFKFNKGRELALSGENSTTYICPSCAKTFFDWGVSRMLKGDKKIESILTEGSIDDTQNLLAMFSDNKINSDLKSNAEAMSKRIERNQKTVTTFGDLEVLQKLKLQMSGQ